MKKKEKLLLNPLSASRDESVGLGSRISGKDVEKEPKHPNQRIAKSLETSICYLTNIPFNFCSVEVKDASMKGDQLIISIQTDLLLPEPSGDSGEYLGTRKQFEEFRRAFEKHLEKSISSKNRRTLSNLLHSEFDAFVRTIIKVGNQNVMRLVRKTTERKGAGRPRMNLGSDIVGSLEARGEVIRKSRHEIRNEIGTWKPANFRLDDDEHCKDHLRKAYSSRFGWIPMFLEYKWGIKTTTRRGDEKKVRISDLTTWSAADRADLIVLEEYRQRTQQSVSLSKFQRRKIELRASRRASLSEATVKEASLGRNKRKTYRNPTST